MFLRNIGKISIPLSVKSLPGFRYCNRHTESSSNITAGVLIIGDEILNGQTEDTNSTFLIKNLNLAGLKISKIAVLPDDVNAISEEVSSLSEKCSVVLTSGGIGPTHDDVTYEAVAKAFSENLSLNKELSILFEDYFGSSSEQNEAVKKFSSLPQSAVLHFGINKYGMRTKFPLVSVKNVYMFPGVPTLLQKSFNVFKANFCLHNSPVFMKSIFLTLDEFSLTPVLNKAVKLFDGRVKFGSYPSFNEASFKVKIILESPDENFITEACDYFNNELPKGCIVNFKSLTSSLKDEL